MIRLKELKQLEDLYQHILTENKMGGRGGLIRENLMDDLAALKSADKTDADEVKAKADAIARDDGFQTALKSKMDKRPELRRRSEEDIYKAASRIGRGGITNLPATDESGVTSKEMLQVNVRQVNSLFDTVYRTNLQTGTAGMILYGASGIGKSDIVRQNAAKFAANENRALVMWAHADADTREKVFNNPRNYYVVSIMNAGQIPAEKWTGIPNVMSKDDFVEERPFKDIAIFMLPGISGMLFLDELNHADKEKMNALFSVVLEKRAGNRALANNRLMICAAGNIGSGHHTMDIPKALVNRVSSYYLVVRPEDWFQWAEKNNIHSTILAFVKSDPANNFYARTTAKSGKGSKLDTHVGFPCPRNFEMLSDSIGPIYEKYLEGYYDEWAEEEAAGRDGIEYFFEELHRIAAGRMGSTWADYYISFLRYYSTYGNLDKLIGLNPKQLAHHYAGLSSGDNLEQRDVLNVIAAITHYLSTALVNALDKTGMFESHSKLKPEFAGIIRDPNDKEEVERAKALYFNTVLKCSDLEKVLSAIGNVFKTVVDTTETNKMPIETKELGTIIMNGVVGGFTARQKEIYNVAVTAFATKVPIINTLKQGMSEYITDAGLRKIITTNK